MDTDDKKKNCSESCGCEHKPVRRRGLTSLTLQWIAEKFRKAEHIKAGLEDGTYTVDSNKVAKAILSAEGEKS